MGIIRVFPRKTNATPIDDLAFYDEPGLFPPEADEIHVSVTFDYDIEKAYRLSDAWSKIGDVKIGGPAIRKYSDDFVPGMYLKPGYVITSRGCPNNCWFCDVRKREGDIQELPITSGWNVLDSNLLACSDLHIEKVFAMLERQKQPVQFTGGLEAKRLTDKHVAMLWDLRPKQMFFAYDTPDDLEPLIEAGKKLRYADFTRSHLRCYVLIGYPKDTFEAAEKRLIQVWTVGFMPMAMLWRNQAGKVRHNWSHFQKIWSRPAIIKSRIRFFEQPIMELAKWKPTAIIGKGF